VKRFAFVFKGPRESRVTYLLVLPRRVI